MRAILLVDDEPDILASTAMLLAIHGYTVAEAPNGAAAWDILQQQRFDLMLTDWTMPQMDGVELCRKVRSSEHLRTLRIIMVSAASTPPEESDALIDRYMRKPMYFADLLKIIDELLTWN